MKDFRDYAFVAGIVVAFATVFLAWYFVLSDKFIYVSDEIERQLIQVFQESKLPETFDVNEKAYEMIDGHCEEIEAK
jgi:hypothetical protein